MDVMTARMECITGKKLLGWDDSKYLQSTYPGDWWDVLVTHKLLNFS